MHSFRSLVVALLALMTFAAAPSAFAADKPALSRSSPPPNPVPGPNPGPPLQVCKHAGPGLTPQQKCVVEAMYRQCGCMNSCTVRFGRPAGNTDPNWDPKPLNKCKGDCGRVAAREEDACYKR